MRHIVILGNGITGITTARELRKSSDDRITVISSETRHFFSRPALMYIYMGHMKYEHTKPYEDWFWEKNRIDLIQGKVEAIDFKNKSLKLSEEAAVSYDILVLATGSQSNKFGWPGQELKGVQGLYGYPDVMSMEENTKGISRGVIVGGGLIGVELAEMLLSRGIHVTFLVREKKFWNMVLPEREAEMVERHIRVHHVDLRMESELKEIIGDGAGRVKRVTTKSGETIECGFVGLAVGVSPNIAFLKGSGLETDRGILVDALFRTNIPGVYAAGDCAQFRQPLPGRRPVEQVWYTGKMHGEFLAKIISGKKMPYSPGIWFNSAKFFDIEYQTYGSAPSKCPPDEDGFYWEDPAGRRAVRLHFRKSDQAILGFNFMGIRARHQVCEQWIVDGRDLTYVLRHLGALNFDPEFFTGFEQSLIAQYNSAHPHQTVKMETRKGLFSRIANGIKAAGRSSHTTRKESV